MSANPYTTPRPTWTEVMVPLADSALWPFIRKAASRLLEIEFEGSGCGISSSDVNHRVFGVASWVDRSNLVGYPGRVLGALLDEVEWLS